jgi:hypothetical protein
VPPDGAISVLPQGGPFSRVLAILNLEWPFEYSPVRSCGRKRLDEASHRQSNVIGDYSAPAAMIYRRFAFPILLWGAFLLIAKSCPAGKRQKRRF